MNCKICEIGINKALYKEIKMKKKLKRTMFVEFIWLELAKCNREVISNQSTEVFLKVRSQKHQSLGMLWKIFQWLNKFGKYCVIQSPIGDLNHALIYYKL